MADGHTAANPRTPPYPGGKSKLAPWITDRMRSHTCYVEPFAGSASVLAAKPRSRSEAINDADPDVANFWTVLATRRDELKAALPEQFVETLHDQYAAEICGDATPPGDDVERAARWFYTRYSQHSAKLTRPSGFKTSAAGNPARAYQNAVEHIDALAARLQGVQILHGDWHRALAKFESENTLAYLDPPYLDEGDDLYSIGIDHGELVAALREFEGDWMVSYRRVPDALREAAAVVVERDVTYSMSARKGGECKDATERLLLSYDPSAVPLHSPNETLPGVTR